MGPDLLEGRVGQVLRVGEGPGEIACGKASVAGSVSQRACVFCGSRVVLYPIADALHLVHGPIGCASYTWDIRGSLSSGPQLHRMSFSTDLREKDIVFGGEKKLAACLDELIGEFRPNAAFVYSTCVVGVIGDDMDAVCAKAAKMHGIPVIAVKSEGFKGTKRDGYRAACEAIFKIIGEGDLALAPRLGINLLGEFNLAGESWLIEGYFKRIGVEVVATLTGDGRVEKIARAHGARLNVVQCSGSMKRLAVMMEERYGIPYIEVSFFGIEDMAEALYEVASRFPEEPSIMQRAQDLVREELERLAPKLGEMRRELEGKRAAIYVGGAFKATSLVKALRHVGVSVVVAGSQTGNSDDYRELSELCEEGTVIVDDSNPRELASFMCEKGVDVLIGGVKERPIAYKLGIGFVDHNHERKTALAGFQGMLNFALEVRASALSPVWQFFPGRKGGKTA